MFVERLATQPRRLVPYTDSLKRDRSHALPQRCRIDVRSKPLRVAEVSPQPRLQPADALLPDQEPKLQRPEPPPQRNAPIAEIFDLRIRRRPQIARVRGHHTNQMLRITHEVGGAIKGSSQPFVRISHDRVGTFDAIPQR